MENLKNSPGAPMNNLPQNRYFAHFSPIFFWGQKPQNLATIWTLRRSSSESKQCI